MHNLSPYQLCKLWAELSSAMYHANDYGEDVAEIYCYTVMRMVPGYDMGKNDYPSKYHLQHEKDACKSFVEACNLFTNVTGGLVYIQWFNGENKKIIELTPDEYLQGVLSDKYRFVWRLHVKVNNTSYNNIE